jgi:hypothetical protein
MPFDKLRDRLRPVGEPRRTPGTAFDRWVSHVEPGTALRPVGEPRRTRDHLRCFDELSNRNCVLRVLRGKKTENRPSTSSGTTFDRWVSPFDKLRDRRRTRDRLTRKRFAAPSGRCCSALRGFGGCRLSSHRPCIPPLASHAVGLGGVHRRRGQRSLRG